MKLYENHTTCNIYGYSKKYDILNPGGPRKSDVFFVFGKNK